MQGPIREIHQEIARLQVELEELQPKLVSITADLKADSKRKLQLYNQAKALDGEIHTLEEKKPILQHEVESSIQGLTEVELSWAECRNSLASAEKKAADAVIAMAVSDIITASVSLEQTPPEAYVTDPEHTSDPSLLLQTSCGTEGKTHSDTAQSSNSILDLTSIIPTPPSMDSETSSKTTQPTNAGQDKSKVDLATNDSPNQLSEP